MIFRNNERQPLFRARRKRKNSTHGGKNHKTAYKNQRGVENSPLGIVRCSHFHG